MKSHPAVGEAMPSQTNLAAQVQFPLAGIRPPNWKMTESQHFPFWYLYLLLNDEDFFSIEFHILLEKELPNQKL